ncbi:hypothetical protein TSUD_107050 [Trifolium subterraneum]|uniref:Uncharacterized protein n=1 Tax=Trifolium subterraneum TaxID=3900 RepID=A0A2Z6LU89_TRISU|nr:hypothetical protein TSUD_107050 [Trifolium subterraneum]
MARTKNIGRQITPQSSPSSTPSPQSSSPPPPPTPMQNASETNFDTFKTANNSEAVSPTQNKIMSNQTPSKNTSEEQLAEAIVRLSQIVPTEETTPHKKSPTRPKEIPTSSKSPFHFQYSRKPLITSPVRRSARISLGIGTAGARRARVGEGARRFSLEILILAVLGSPEVAGPRRAKVSDPDFIL